MKKRRNEQKQGRKTRIFLCDLTHVDGETLSSNVFPLGIGLIGAYLLASDLGTKLEIELFKYPSDLNRRLVEGGAPEIIGFANYSWSLEISKAFAKSIKTEFPAVVTVFGGPNYGLSEDELCSFWNHVGSYLDFNIVLEGEVAFYNLVATLILRNFDLARVKSEPYDLKNVHFLTSDGVIYKAELAERIDIEDLPSPYLDTALMDKFFDGKLIPLTHSTRGCPFKCTFCSEGAEYYNKVKQRSRKLYDEYRHIAERALKEGVFDLMLSDANYGMFKEDAARADMLARVQKEFGYPRNVYVSTGKNQKERVLGAVKKLNGAIQLSASLQSTNPQVLKNIDRSNISIEVLSNAAREALDNDVVSYTELILGLPGETRETHLRSILDVTKAGFVNIRIYQLILLPQTELNTQKTRSLYGLKTKFRPMPRSFGNYQILSRNTFVAEYEEIVVQSNSMPYEDYIHCRKLGLLIDVIHNGFIFRECQRLLASLGVRWDEFLEYILRLFEYGRFPRGLTALLDEFIRLMEVKLFESLDDLNQSLSEADTREHVRGLTSNELAIYKADILLNNFQELNKFVFDTVASFVSERDIVLSKELVDALSRYSFHSKHLFLIDYSEAVLDIQLSESDLKRFLNSIGQSIPSDCYHSASIKLELTLCHNVSQRTEIERLLSFYGADLEGLARIVMRSPILDSKFRQVKSIRVDNSSSRMTAMPEVLDS